MTVPSITHITSRTEWQTAQAQGYYEAPSLHSEGFIHCSTLDQVAATANRYYRGQHDLVLLYIDPTLLEPEMIYEEAPSVGEWFPHLYGRLNLDAVISVNSFEPDADGVFHSPPEV